ncbi:hypothetical protein [Paraburkholderia terrae]|nr:hypothetical protein [Paraburkholderia terrae]
MKIENRVTGVLDGSAYIIRQASVVIQLKELGGWSDYDMALHYSHLALDHLAQHANAVKIWAHPTPDNPGTPAKAVGQVRRKALCSKGSSDTAPRRIEVDG